MSGASGQRNWTATLAWGLLLLLVGAGIATWGLSRWRALRDFLGVEPPNRTVGLRLKPGLPATVAIPLQPDTNLDARVTSLESRSAMSRVYAAGGRFSGFVQTPCWLRSPPAGLSIAEWRWVISSLYCRKNSGPRTLAQLP